VRSGTPPPVLNRLKAIVRLVTRCSGGFFTGSLLHPFAGELVWLWMEQKPLGTTPTGTKPTAPVPCASSAGEDSAPVSPQYPAGAVGPELHAPPRGLPLSPPRVTHR
jgi:hypothetical protein